MARRASSEPDFDREVADLPPSLRWREWKARVVAVLFAAPKPVTREFLARVVGRDCALDLLLDDLREDLRGRPIELVWAGESFSAFGPAVRVAFVRFIPILNQTFKTLTPPSRSEIFPGYRRGL